VRVLASEGIGPELLAAAGDGLDELHDLSVQHGRALFCESGSHIAHRLGDDTRRWLSAWGMRAWAALPLGGDAGGRAVLHVLSSSLEAIHSAERAYLSSIADLGAQSLAHLRLGTQQRRRVQRELAAAREELFRSELSRLQELEVVHAFQRAALPQGLPEVDGLDVAASYLPAQESLEVGGDWYDLVVLDDGSLLLSVGDVSGHGIHAAGVMAQLRTAVRAYAVRTGAVEHILEQLNEFLCRQDFRCFATAVVARYDITRHHLCWAVAGHPPPVRFGRHRAALLDEGGCRGTVLGAWRGLSYSACSTTLDPGDGVLLYTDGLVERRSEIIDEGFARLLGVLGAGRADRSLDDVLDAVIDAMVVELRDDVCGLAVRRSA
jgi:serine phosphatase RsbU (regulator of sigma subunit)